MFYIIRLKRKLLIKTEAHKQEIAKNELILNQQKEQYETYIQAIDRAYEELQRINLEIQDNSSKLKNVKDLIDARNEQLNTVRESIAIAQDCYDKELEKKKEEVDEEYRQHVESIQNNITSIMEAYGKQCDTLSKTIKTYENYIASFIEAQKKEQEKKDNILFYKISLSDLEEADVNSLLKLAFTLSQPDVLRKLVYKTYFEKKMNDLLGRVVGANSEISAIYKITHIETGMAYIGQAVNIKERWRKHLKCGLGIDTPATNAFYQAMIKHHPWNFTWEILEECPKDRLNEAEKFYIDFYQTKTWGWNSKGGNTK